MLIMTMNAQCLISGIYEYDGDISIINWKMLPSKGVCDNNVNIIHSILVFMFYVYLMAIYMWITVHVISMCT